MIAITARFNRARRYLRARPRLANCLALLAMAAIIAALAVYLKGI